MTLNSRSVIFSAALVIGATASLSAQDEVTFNVPGASVASASATADSVAPTFTEAQLLETFGWFIGRRVGLTELEFSPVQVAAMIKGLQTAAAGGDAPYDLEQIGPAMDAFMQEKQAAYMNKLREQGMAESAAFLAEVRAREGVVSLPSGLAYEVFEDGTGPKPKATDSVKVEYVGRLVDGTVFDSSEGRGPAEFPVDGVIAGWTEGLQQLNQGSKGRLYIPPHLAYGDSGQGGIPPAATLIFDVELLEVTAAPAAEAEAPAEVPSVQP